MRTFVPTPDEHGRDEYGLGLEHYALPGGVEMVGHMGTTAGFRAYMFHLPAQNVDIAMVTDRRRRPDADPRPDAGGAGLTHGRGQTPAVRHGEGQTPRLTAPAS